MVATNQMKALMRDVQRCLDIIALLDNYGSLEKFQKQLMALNDRLGQVALTPSTGLDHRADRDFYSIIESHPQLRKVYEVVFQETMVELCGDGLKYYADLGTRRALTSREREQLNAGQEVYVREADKLERLLREVGLGEEIKGNK